jgi:hypothetical protein
MIGTIMWEYVLGGATLFGLIVGLFSIYNGRATRKLLLEEQRHTRELIAKIDERIAKIDERFEVLLKALDAHIKASTIEHQEIMRRLTEH